MTYLFRALDYFIGGIVVLGLAYEIKILLLIGAGCLFGNAISCWQEYRTEKELNIKPFYINEINEHVQNIIINCKKK